MSKLIDLTGQRFGHLVVIEKDPTKGKNTRWICKCDCGKICSKASASLRNGQATCCNRDKCQFAKKRYIDLTNQKFGRLTVLFITNEIQGNEHIWHCRCDCGNEVDVTGVSLREGRTKSCGCLKKEKDKSSKPHLMDLTGMKFGHLTVLERAGSDDRGEPKWLCECDCKNKTKLIVLSGNLRRGHTQSCGCIRRSHGELKVSQLLNDNNINYIQEYNAFKFSSNKWAKFDFFVENKYFIEYDGETHYKANLHGWHDEKQLKAQQERDIIKNQWCKDNNIPLIRIPYWRLEDLSINDLKLETSEFILK